MQPKNKQLNNMKRSNTFKRALAGFFITSVAVILAGLVWFWGFLGRYERSTPEAALREFTQLIKNGSYDEIYERGGFQETDHNTRDDFIAALKKAFPSDADDLRYQKKASKDKELKYTVFANGEACGEIELVNAGSKTGTSMQAKPVLQKAVGIKIKAPDFVNIYLDGQPLSKDGLERAPVAYYNGVPEGLQPSVLTYELNGLLFVPTITAQRPDSSECAIVEQNGVYTVTALPSESEAQLFSELIEKGAKTYAAFISKDASFGAIDALLWKNSPVQKGLRNFSNMWYIEHDGYAYENVEIKDIELTSDNTFTGKISFDHIIKRGSKRNVYPSNYRMVFLKQDNVWKIYDINMLS